MSKANYTRNPIHITVLRCTWTQGGQEVKYDFTHQGDALEALIACQKAVLGSRYSDFKVVLKSTRTL